jgi:excinuclease UvrABC nuclease subunit
MIIYGILLNRVVVYIGQTVMSLNKRKSSHISSAKNGKKWPICKALRKYKYNMEFIIIETTTNQFDLDRLEKYYINYFKPRYNLQNGGKLNFIPWNKGKKETRKKVLINISKSAKNRISPKRGTYSEKHKQKISEGVKNSCKKPFKCLNNNKIYFNKVECAKELNIDPRGISIVLMPNTRLKSYKGYRFEYLVL